MKTTTAYVDNCGEVHTSKQGVRRANVKDFLERLPVYNPGEIADILVDNRKELIDLLSEE